MSRTFWRHEIEVGLPEGLLFALHYDKYEGDTHLTDRDIDELLRGKMDAYLARRGLSMEGANVVVTMRQYDMETTQ